MTLEVQLVQLRIAPYRRPVFKALAESRGIDLTVWSDLTIPGSPTPDEPLGFRIRHAPARWIGPVLWQPGSIQAVRESGTDVAILGWNTRSLDVPLALRAAGRRVGTVLWGHGFGKSSPRAGDLLRRLFSNRADACLLYGPSTRRRMIDLGLEERRAFAAPNAIDQSAIVAAARDWRSRPDELEEFRARHAIGRPSILFLSRLEPDKHPETLVEAFDEVVSTCPHATLVFIGDGSSRAEVEAVAERRGVRDRVRLGGAIFEESDIAPWALSSDLLVHPGGIGLSLMHAFGYGLPVVTTDRMSLHGPEVEILSPGENGLLYRHGDASDLAAKILEIVGDEPRRERMSQSARNTVSGPTGRNIEGMVGGMLEAIDHAAAQHGKSRL